MTTEQAVYLRNDSRQALTLRLDAVDGSTGPMGGVSYGLEDDPVEEMARWITLERSRVSLQAGASASIGFRIVIPAEVTAGEHVAGIAVTAAGQDDAPSESASDQAGTSVVVHTRRIVAVQVNVPGRARPKLEISGVRPDPRTDAVYVEIEIENAGRAFAEGDGVIEIDETSFVRPFHVDTFVPDTSIRYPIRWSVTPEDGDYPTRVMIRYGSRTARWEGTFTIGAAEQEVLSRRRGSTFPFWLLLLGGLAALGLIAAVVVIARRWRSKKPVSDRVSQTRSHDPTTGRGSSRSPSPPPPPGVGERS